MTGPEVEIARIGAPAWERKLYSHTLPDGKTASIDYEHDPIADVYRMVFSGELLRSVDWSLVGPVLTALANTRPTAAQFHLAARELEILENAGLPG